MEDIDIDSLVDIPDTPDRFSLRRMNGRLHVGNLYAAGHVEGSNSSSLDRLRGRGRVVAENELNRKHYKHPQKPSGGVDESEHRKNTIVLSPLEKSRASAALSRKTTMERSRNSISEQYIDKGKGHLSKMPSKSSGFGKDHAVINLTGRNMHKPEMEFPRGGSEAKGKQEGQVPRNGGSFMCKSSSNAATSRNNCKGKEKIDDIGFKGVGSVMDHAKGVNLSGGSPLSLEKRLSASHNSDVSLRAPGKKRLVRNGCIAPQNIAIRAKQFNEQSQNSFKSEQNFGNVVSNNPFMTDITEIISGDNNLGKGKGVVHPHVPKDHDINFMNLSGRAMSNHGEPSGTNGDAVRDEWFDTKGGWRSTRSRSKNLDHVAAHHFNRSKNVGCHVSQQNENKVVKRGDASRGNKRILSGCPENCDATQTAPVKFNQISEPSNAENLPKRQKKHTSTSGDSGESSRVNPNDADIVFLGSSWEPSSSRSSRINIGRHPNVIDLYKSSEMRGVNANFGDSVNDEESEARARQVEADERLARELQEQLFYEVPIFVDDETDENIARALQQEEDALPTTSIHSLNEPHRRGFTRQSRTQSSSRTSQSSSNRRGIRARFSSTARVPRLRNQALNQRRAVPSSRTRSFNFPSYMDLDLRLNMLEIMEAQLADSIDIRVAGDLFRRRDFNDSDYEMFLALDENNHQHTGASNHQINSLPLSKVQTENAEVCAVCLETPAVGETVRHLPCLHKFHKDCIDPWLSRKTSCPVCKSSIN